MLNLRIFDIIKIHKDNLAGILHRNLPFFPQITLGDELLNHYYERRHKDPCNLHVICCQELTPRW